jgi:ERCC4-type nuclease
MNPVEIEQALSTLTVLVDTREQPTEALRERLKATGFPCERKKLDFGDYSCKVILPGGEECDLSWSFSIERKMSIDELAICFTTQRDRFAREFERSKENNARVYLLVENGSYERILAGRYRSKVSPSSLMASIFAFMARYDCKVIFCKPETTGRIIREIVYREAKEILKSL